MFHDFISILLEPTLLLWRGLQDVASRNLLALFRSCDRYLQEDNLLSLR